MFLSGGPRAKGCIGPDESYEHCLWPSALGPTVVVVGIQAEERRASALLAVLLDDLLFAVSSSHEYNDRSFEKRDVFFIILCPTRERRGVPCFTPHAITKQFI